MTNWSEEDRDRFLPHTSQFIIYNNSHIWRSLLHVIHVELAQYGYSCHGKSFSFGFRFVVLSLWRCRLLIREDIFWTMFNNLRLTPARFTTQAVRIWAEDFGFRHFSQPLQRSVITGRDNSVTTVSSTLYIQFLGLIQSRQIIYDKCMFIQLPITHNKKFLNIFLGTSFGSKNSMWIWYNCVLRLSF